MTKPETSWTETIVVLVVALSYTNIHEFGHVIGYLLVGVSSTINIIYVPFFAFVTHATSDTTNMTIIDIAIVSFAGGGFGSLVSLAVYTKYKFRVVAWFSIISLIGGMTEMIFCVASRIQYVSFVDLVSENVWLYVVIQLAPAFVMFFQELNDILN